MGINVTATPRLNDTEQSYQEASQFFVVGSDPHGEKNNDCAEDEIDCNGEHQPEGYPARALQSNRNAQERSEKQSRDNVNDGYQRDPPDNVKNHGIR